MRSSIQHIVGIGLGDLLSRQQRLGLLQGEVNAFDVGGVVGLKDKDPLLDPADPGSDPKKLNT